MNAPSPDTSPTLSLDTEFVWTQTYYARLGLVQAAPSPAFDRARLPSGPPETFPFHAHTKEEAQDVQHLSRWTGAAQAPSLFDTRRAAGFCGLPSSMSLAALLEETLGVKLAKTETRTDWCRRPLSPEQLEYAAQDVAWLHDAARELLRRARERGTEAWLFEEMVAHERAISADLAEPPVERAWTRLRLPYAVRQDAAAFRRAQSLAAWRERTARERDLPRKWVVADDVLVGAALRPPRSPQDLPRRALPPSFQHGFFAALRDAAAGVGFADSPSADDLAREREREDARRRVRDRVTAALGALAERAKTLGVDPALFASRAEMTEWMLDPDNPEHPLNRGWRREARGDALRDFGGAS